MVVAKKKYYYDDRELMNDTQDKVVKKSKKRVKSIFNYKIGMIMGIIVLSSLCIFLLTRYTAINEIKFRIHNLNKEISTTEVEIQDLKAELDKLIRSDIIEEKAIAELDMQYPQYEQIFFLTVDEGFDTEQSIINEEANLLEYENENNFLSSLKTSFEKLYSLLD